MKNKAISKNVREGDGLEKTWESLGFLDVYFVLVWSFGVTEYLCSLWYSQRSITPTHEWCLLPGRDLGQYTTAPLPLLLYTFIWLYEAVHQKSLTLVHELLKTKLKTLHSNSINIGVKITVWSIAFLHCKNFFESSCIF